MKNITKVPIYFFVLLVICVNFIPLASASPFLEYYSGSIDDDNSGSSSGNSNGKINPEETIEITVKIENNGNTDVSGVTGELRLKKSNPHVTIIDDDASYGTIESTERKEGTFVFHVSDVKENSIYESISFEVILTDSSGNTWTDSFTKYVDFPSITVPTTETSTFEPTDTDTHDSNTQTTTTTITSESTDSDAFDPTVTEISDSDDSNLNPYFPLDVGRQWTYVWFNDKYHPEEITEILEVTSMSGYYSNIKASSSTGASGDFQISNSGGELMWTNYHCRGYNPFPEPMYMIPYYMHDLDYFLNQQLSVGESWSGTSYGFTQTSKVISEESITVQAGTYNTLKIETIYDTSNDYISGIRYMWFAKDVGLVKFAYYHDDGSTTVGQLKLEGIEIYNIPPSKYIIDGYSNDWSSIEPVVTDQKGDGVSGVSGTDIKAVYADSDENYLYLMMELWDGPTNPHINEEPMFDGDYIGRYRFKLISIEDEDILIILYPYFEYSQDSDKPHYYYELEIRKYPSHEILYSSYNYDSYIDGNQNFIYTGEDVIEIQIPLDVIEIPDFLNIQGGVNVLHALDANHDDFSDRTDYYDEHLSLLFQISDFKNLSDLIIKLQNAQDPLSRYFINQFSKDTLRLLDEYNGQGTPSEALQKTLVDELNRILQSGNLYDEQRFENVELSDELLKLIEDNPQGQDLIELNRLLLEEAYPQEIETHRQKVDKKIPGFSFTVLSIALILVVLIRRKNQ